MRYSRPNISTSLFLLFTLLAAFNGSVRADDDKDADEYDETARVARVSMIRGDVQLQRNGSKSWEDVHANFPLVEGDTLATTGIDARLEIQIDARNFVRVGPDSILRIVTLRDEGVALSLSEGVMSVRLARFDRNKEYFEIDAPGTTLAAEARGLYRLDASQTGSVRLTVRDGGQARIYSETSGFTLRDGRTAALIADGTNAGDWDLNYAEARDNWDIWVDERERYLASNLRFDGRDRYYDTDVWGAEELDTYGEWVYSNDYGWVWRPSSTAINSYSDWAPYRYGHWVWCPPYGWTWVGDEPWGWAPYHYGRWVYYNDNWCWTPRGYGVPHRRSWWRPALVVFVYIPTSSGERVCWYPLTYGQHDPRSRRFERLEALRSNDLARLRRTNPAYLRAITTLPARDFGRHAAQGQRAPDEIARRAVTTEPVRGRLPIAPTGGETNATRRHGDAETRVLAARPPTSTGATATLRDRPTGAAARLPGVPLDNDLRRTRLYNGREPRSLTGASTGNSSNGSGGNTGAVDSGNTGAVARPPRVRSTTRQPVERGTQGNNGNSVTPNDARPVRPARTNPDERRVPLPVPLPTITRPEGGDTGPEPAPRQRSASPRRDGDGDAASRPARRPESRPEPRPESQPVTRPEPRPQPRPEPRMEQPQPRPEPRTEPRPEPRQESRPESKPEPQKPQESKPAPSREDAPARPSKRKDDR
jgi:hypothetical protein